VKSYFSLAVGALLAFAAPSAHATLVYDNMFQASAPGWPTDALPNIDGPVLAASFTTGSDGFLHALHLLLSGGDPTAPSGAFLVWVAPDLGGTPDLNPIDALWNSGPISDTAFTANTGNGYWDLGFDPIAQSVPLAGSARYWVVMASDGSSPTSLTGWVYASEGQVGGIGVAGEGWYVACSGCYPTYPAGPETDSNETGPYVMSVDVTLPGGGSGDVALVPEPTSLAILGLGIAGLGFAGYRARAPGVMRLVSVA